MILLLVIIQVKTKQVTLLNDEDVSKLTHPHHYTSGKTSKQFIILF